MSFPTGYVLTGTLVIAWTAIPSSATSAPRATLPRAGVDVASTARPGSASTPTFAFVGGGEYNTVSGNPPAGAFGVVTGGYGNHLTGEWGTIGGGQGNVLSGPSATIGGGGGNQAGGTFAVIGGGYANTIRAGGASAGEYGVVAGGYANLVTGDYAVVVGGNGNTATGIGGVSVGGAINNANSPYSFVGSGQTNTINTNGNVGGGNGAANASIVGGIFNTVKPLTAGGAQNAFIGAGNGNVVSGVDSAIAGGAANVANGAYSTIPGGERNYASGTASFAAGTQSAALHAGTFVWSDNSTPASVLGSTAANQFLARAAGGFYLYSSATLRSGVQLAPGSGSWSTLSDRASKTAITTIDDARILSKVAALPIAEWSYREQRPSVRHIGPMAQDFRSAFGLGEDNRHIATVDEDGVALAAIKALARQVTERDNQLAQLRSADARKFAAFAATARADERKRSASAALLAHLEARLASLEGSVAAMQRTR